MIRRFKLTLGPRRPAPNPQTGSLAVPDARAITAPVSHLLSLPFPLKLATRDWHPPSHISFAPNHHHQNAPPSSKEGEEAAPHPPPFTSTATITHPADPSLTYETTLWPVHCVADTPGAQLVQDPHLNLAARVDGIIDKGRDPRVEMYSAFYDPFRVEDSGLAARLRDARVTHVYVVGLAADFCVRATAEHAAEEGYTAYIVEEGTRPVMPDKWPACRDELVAKGVKMVSIDGDEVKRVAQLDTAK